MGKGIIKFIAVYVSFVALFTLQRVAFMLIFSRLIGDMSFQEVAGVLSHGLPMDLSIAGYLTVIPGLLIIARLWSSSRAISMTSMVYYAIISLLLGVIFLLDILLYNYWGFRLDTTPLFYFTSSPGAALASAETFQIILAPIVTAALAWAIYRLLWFIDCRIEVKPSLSPLAPSAIMLLLTALLFIPIRGGFTVSTMNLSRAYFSQNQRLNHAAVNPAFSLMYSATHQSDFGAQFRFMTDREATEEIARLNASPSSPDVAADTVPLLKTPRPDIYIVILESFSVHLLPSLGGEPIATGLDSIAEEGLSFTNIYANSFRTDRGIPSILSSFPGLPSTSLMKYVEKTEGLPSLPGCLKDAGYHPRYYYGGDINFTNMQAYIVNAGFEEIISDKDFPISDRTGKWGAHDHLLFERVMKDVAATPADAGPQLRVIQTSSSHEPFKVPYSNATFAGAPDKNAFAYTDSCLTAFVGNLRSNPRYGNTLIIFVPDHQGCYPHNIENAIDRHHIPLIMTGGALARKGREPVIGSQIDLSATLLAAMGIDSGTLPLSKNLLADGPHYAVFTEPSLMALVTPSDTALVNCDADAVIFSAGPNADATVKAAKAYLQRLYDNIDAL